MDGTEILQVVASVALSALVIGSFGWGVIGVLAIRRDSGPLVQGIRVWSRALRPGELDGLRTLPERSGGDWGWARRDATHAAVFADPYSRVDGMRVETPLPYRAVVALEAETPVLEYRAPTGFVVLISVVLLPIAPLLLGLNHVLLSRKIEARLTALLAEA